MAANGTTYGTLSYHPNLLVSQIAHGNGMTETQTNDPNGMRRPATLGASGPFAAWSSGTYSYDGAGNVKAIGGSAFTYDSLSRLVSSTQFDGPAGGGNLKQQSYAFDNFGNLTAITTNGVLRNTPTSATTNRLTSGMGNTTNYDAAGNLTKWNGAIYGYDAFNQMIRMTSGGEDWAYVYTADDERVWSYDVNRVGSRWTLRDLGGQVLREYRNDHGRWSVTTDYFYRNGLLLAAETLTGRHHFHLDHLGTPRLITRGSGYPAAYHLYYPFGEEATAFNQDAERMKFTGHERDLASLTGAGDDLDYMHARHESPVTARFLGVDPVGANPQGPQSWNGYSYVMGRPLTYTDPYGMFAMLDHSPPPAGMTLEDYGYAEGISVTGKAWRGTTRNPNTGLWGLHSLIYGGRSLRSPLDFNLGPAVKVLREYYQNRFGHDMDIFVGVFSDEGNVIFKLEDELVLALSGLASSCPGVCK